MAGEGGNATGRAEGRRLPAKGKSRDAGCRDAGSVGGGSPLVSLTRWGTGWIGNATR